MWEKAPPFDIIYVADQSRRKRRRAAVGGSAWRAACGPGSGEQQEQQQVGSDRHLGSRASGAGCPFLLRAERKVVRTGAATARVRPDDTLRVPSRGSQSSGLSLFWAAWWPSGSCQFPVSRSVCLHGRSRPWASWENHPKQKMPGSKGRQTCQTELALTCKLWASGIRQPVQSARRGR